MQALASACRRLAGTGPLRALAVLLACAGLAATTLAGASGGSTDPGAAVVAAALKHKGDAYVWGGNGPKEWDCSGLTSGMWREVGGVRDIPRTSRQQQAWAVPLPAEQTLPGDLVFFGDPVTHVGLVEKRTTSKGVTSVLMVDASSSLKGVTERTVWTSGVIRYGRVPRKGMTPVVAWTPKPVVTAPAAATRPATTATTTKTTTTTKATTGAPVSAQAVVPLAAGKKPLAGLPAVQKAPSSAVATRAVVLARAALGNTRLTDVELIANVWSRAGGRSLPATRAGLAAATHRVSLSDARVGDLVVYAAPYSHVGIYVGDGLMVDASRTLGRVVLRQVWAGQGVTLQRIVR